DGPLHRRAGQGRRPGGRRRPREQRPGQAHRLRRSRPHGHRRAVRRELIDSDRELQERSRRDPPRTETGLTMDQDRITELINKSEITSIVNSYFRALDEKNFDAQHFASIFTPQAKVTRPNGASLIGPEEISASHEKSFARFEGSQHFVAGHDISLEGSTASLRANLIAMHMWQGSKTDANKLDNFFIAGGVIHATLTQADGQWRISKMGNVVLWRAGGFR